MVAERESLASTNVKLVGKVVSMERATESLEAERIRLIDEVETLSLENETLEARSASLEAQVAELNSEQEGLTTELVERTAERDAAQEAVREIQVTYQGLVDDLETEVSRGSIEIEQLRNGLRLAVSDEILFESGSAELGEDGREVLVTISEHLANIDYAVEVIGHSDNQRIRNSLARRYPSNWELAGARAASVVRVFLSRGVEGKRLQASSRAEFDPLVVNDSAVGRARNRRIEIFLRPLPNTTLQELPDAMAPGGGGGGSGTS